MTQLSDAAPAPAVPLSSVEASAPAPAGEAVTSATSAASAVPAPALAPVPAGVTAPAQPEQINRELSLLAFNQRVLAQALDTGIPLLERLKFLCISSANLDEFFEIRVAGLQQTAELAPHQRLPDGSTVGAALTAIGARTRELVSEQYRVFNDVLLPAMAAQDIRFLRRAEWTPAVAEWVQQYFTAELEPILTPIGLDPAHPFPRVLNKALNFIIPLTGKDAFGRRSGYAVVQAPRALPRVIRLPADIAGAGDAFVFLSSVIHAHVGSLFPGMQAGGCFQFRVTRNADLSVDEEEAEDIAQALTDELGQRQFGDTVRLEIAHNCPDELRQFLMEEMELAPVDLYRCDGPVNLMRLMTVPDLIDRPDLKYPPFSQHVPRALCATDFFAELRQRDILLHHPYEALTPIVEWIRQAARDPRVLVIKQTLYRTGATSPIVDALVEAARAGKEVTVVVEVRARFDEADNIALARRLHDAGAHVSYGVVGFKTHAKMLLMVRREEQGLKLYAHMGTGNYHLKTARLYTDYGLFTAEPLLCKDVAAVFMQLTSLGKGRKHTHLLQAPFTLAKGLLQKIECEAEHARAGRPARVVAKMNALVDPELIQALYRASQAGVEIELIVRGMCSLRPGVAGLSETITVRSVIGRFLEHHRVFYFENGGTPEIWLSSADWMERNLHRRVEIAFPLLDDAIRKRVRHDLADYLKDSAQSWFLHPDGSYHKASPKSRGRGVQQKLLETLVPTENR